jgi:Secretion system C-terminal sorting domain
MKKTATVILFLVVLSNYVFAQLRTVTADGNWEDPTRWSGGNIATVATDNVLMDNNRDITLNSPSNFTIGTFTAGNSCILAILNGASLTTGAFTVPNGLNLTVNGNLTINGNLDVTNNINITVTGTFTINGSVVVNNNSSFSVTSGAIAVSGNFTGGNNTAISLTTPGGMSVGGNLFVDNGSTLGGNGTLSVGGTCTGPICGDSQLPIELLYFKAVATLENVQLQWATASELNFDYFGIEKSYDAITFFQIGKVSGQGTSTTKHFYSFIDEKGTVGRAYYRLREVDFDGYEKTFNIAVADFTSQKKVSFFPNPVVDGQVNLELNFRPQSDLLISIVDLHGIILSEFKASQQSFSVPLSVSAGMYLLVVQGSDFRSVNKFLVK